MIPCIFCIHTHQVIPLVCTNLTCTLSGAKLYFTVFSKNSPDITSVVAKYYLIVASLVKGSAGSKNRDVKQ